MDQQRIETPSSPAPSSNISRLGRQITRNILPALRNLVRSNRSSSSSSRTRRQSHDSTSESPLNLSSSVPPLPDVPPLAPAQSSPILDTDGWFADETSTSSHTTEPTPPSLLSSSSSLSSSESISSSSGDTSAMIDQERWFEDVPVYQANTSDLFSPLHRLPSLLRHAARHQSRDESSPLLAPSSSSIHDNTPDHMDIDGESTSIEPSAGPGGEGGRQRYRLVVYFEERAQEDQTATARYVAVIVGRLDELQFLLTNANNPERSFTDMLDHLFNSYKPKGTPPASQHSIDSLASCSVSEEGQRCAICLENFEVGYQATELPCKHSFHGEECVKHWLAMHNSCPVCRYELPVDDQDYEADRKKRMIERGIEVEELNSSTSLPVSTEEANKEEHQHSSSESAHNTMWSGGSADM
eukprot:TRINITY_DN1247_c0_g1_i1.p1 TRINITY_DN1247_c0_g1~~TRINITY_DN1247_c0_g1_i1.p1  ORF type:complete len:412 (+),score=113.55 TRINITY_DN1247_c0_g1_i1:148-1383(+)